MLRFSIFVCALALALASCSAASAADPPSDAAWLFDPDAVVVIDLTLPQESIDALAIDPGEYQPGTFG